MKSGFSYPLPDVYDALEFPATSTLDTRTKQALAHISNTILSWLKNSMAVFINISEEKTLCNCFGSLLSNYLFDQGKADRNRREKLWFFPDRHGRYIKSPALPDHIPSFF